MLLTIPNKKILSLGKQVPLFVYSSLFFLILALSCFALIFVDPRSILGVSPWLKPFKFAISFSLYLISLSFFLPYLNLSINKLLYVSRFIAFCVFICMIAIILQSFSSTLYQFTWPKEGTDYYYTSLFLIANFAVIANTAAASYVFYLFFQKTLPISTSYLWGIRFGLLIFLLSSIEGIFMIFYGIYNQSKPLFGNLELPLISAHSLANLKTSHFLGIHSLQILPVIGYLLKKQENGFGLIILIGMIYLFLWVGLFFIAV
jgi:hypothetical protein